MSKIVVYYFWYWYLYDGIYIYLMAIDGYDKSVLVQVVDWCRQAESNYLSQRRQNLAIWCHQAKL